MSQDFLRSVVHAPRSQRRWFMLPLSVAAHGALALACFVLPTAAGDLPVPPPPSHLVRLVRIAPPPPPPAPQPRQQRRRPVLRADVPPTIASSGLKPERPPVPGGPPGIPVSDALPRLPGIPGGFPAGPPSTAPPRPEPQREAVRVGAGVREPRKIVDVAPVYPRIALEARIEGVVILEAVIATDGRIHRLRVLRSAPLLDDAAVAAVKQWRYTPTLLNGVPVPVLMTITVNFRLD